MKGRGAGGGDGVQPEGFTVKDQQTKRKESEPVLFPLRREKVSDSDSR